MRPLVVLAALLAGGAVAVAAQPPGAGPAARLRALSAAAGAAVPVGPAHVRGRYGARPAVLRTVAALLAAAGVAALVPLPAGAVLAVATGVAVPRVLARLPPEGTDPDQAEAAHVPPALDLLAACLTAGAALPDALLVVAAVTPRPLGARLAEAAAALRLGAPPEQALVAARGQRQLDRLADVLTQASAGGTAPAAAVARLAEEARAQAAEDARAAARRAGVLVVLPLGLCFLPAFVLLGVVPVVAGIAGRLLA